MHNDVLEALLDKQQHDFETDPLAQQVLRHSRMLWAAKSSLTLLYAACQNARNGITDCKAPSGGTTRLEYTGETFARSLLLSPV